LKIRISKIFILFFWFRGRKNGGTYVLIVWLNWAMNLRLSSTFSFSLERLSCRKFCSWPWSTILCLISFVSFRGYAYFSTKSITPLPVNNLLPRNTDLPPETIILGLSFSILSDLAFFKFSFWLGAKMVKFWCKDVFPGLSIFSDKFLSKIIWFLLIFRVRSLAYGILSFAPARLLTKFSGSLCIFFRLILLISLIIL
jgi:hypothetical protein